MITPPISQLQHYSSPTGSFSSEEISPRALTISSIGSSHLSTANQSPPTLTGHLSSKQASGITPRSAVEDILIREFTRIIGAVKAEKITMEKADLIIYEVISKVLAYDVIPPEICIPARVGDSYQFVPFTTEVILLTDRNMGYLFRPHVARNTTAGNISPIMVFRGTSAGTSSGSVLADVGWHSIKSAIFSREVFPSHNVGKKILDCDASIISSILKHNEENGYKKCIFLGHSLGGKLASSFAIEGDNAPYIERLITFNAPGVTGSELAKYNSLNAYHFNATNYATKGDPISGLIASRRFLGKKIIIDPKDISIKTVADRHSLCILSSENFTTQEEFPPRPRRWLKVVRLIGWATGLCIVAAILHRIFILILPAIVAHAIHKGGKKDLLKKAHRATLNYRNFLDDTYTLQDKNAMASDFYYNYLKHPEFRARSNSSYKIYS